MAQLVRGRGAKTYIPRQPGENRLITDRLNRFKSSALQLATNLRGWKTSRKLVVFESDDWGAIRIPGAAAYKALLKKGIRVDRSLYDRLDCLECGSDLEALFGLLGRHHDANGRPAVFTFNAVMGNPDFAAIEADDFQCFHHQSLFASYEQYWGQDLRGLWGSAIQNGLIQPQFHAREHLNSLLWMKDLKAGHEQARLAFEHGFYGLKTKTGSSHQKNYLAAYWAESMEDQQQISSIVHDGLKQFESTFGFPSRTFIGCNYVWSKQLEESLAEKGVELLQTQRGHIQADPTNQGKPRTCRHYTGQRNQYGQRYSVRNVLFEPYLDPQIDWADKALNDIAQSFHFDKPAIVCTHRINYVSGMSVQHRDGNLKQLDKLLFAICSRWPDAEFITADELNALMKADQ